MRSYHLLLAALANLGVGAATPDVGQQTQPRNDDDDANAFYTFGSNFADSSGTLYYNAISAPRSAFTTATHFDGNTRKPYEAGTMAINIILDEDLGPSKDEFPYPNLPLDMIHVLITPAGGDTPGVWGQSSNGPRPNDLAMDVGVRDANAVFDLIQDLGRYVAFDNTTIYLTGIGGGSLLLSGYFMAQNLYKFGTSVQGILLLCGAMQSQVQVREPQNWINHTRIHYQSTQRELAILRRPLIQSIYSTESIASSSDQDGLTRPLSDQRIAQLQTVDNTPNAGHCEFDVGSLITGVDSILAHFADLMFANRSGIVPFISPNSLLKGVPGNEQLQFHD